MKGHGRKNSLHFMKLRDISFGEMKCANSGDGKQSYEVQ